MNLKNEIFLRVKAYLANKPRQLMNIDV